MATRKSTTTAATAAAQLAVEQRREFSINDAFQMLLDNATESSTLTRDELKYLIGGREDARILAGHAARVAEGIGCLVYNDKSVGNFQGGDGFLSLMFLFGGIFRNIEAMNELSELAELTLEQQGEQHA
ncbi:MAG: hypothetical protein KA439_09765 [Rhizobacter sp.]|nr:hypothetical protein [Rhizobacter sp.]